MKRNPMTARGAELLRAELKRLITENIHAKPWGHGLAEHQFALNRAMSEIGG